MGNAEAQVTQVIELACGSKAGPEKSVTPCRARAARTDRIGACDTRHLGGLCRPEPAKRSWLFPNPPQCGFELTLGHRRGSRLVLKQGRREAGKLRLRSAERAVWNMPRSESMRV